MFMSRIAVLFFGLCFIFAVGNVYAQYDFIDSVSMADPCGPYHQLTMNETLRFLEKDNFCWSNWEKKDVGENKLDMFNAITNLYGEIKYHYTYDEDTLSTLTLRAHHARLIDYNQDGETDIITQIWIPWAKTLYTTFWRNRSNKIEKELEVEGDIISMSVLDGQVYLSTYHVLCCGDEVNYIHNFEVNDSIYLKSRLGLKSLRNTSLYDLSKKDKPVTLHCADTLFSQNYRGFEADVIIGSDSKGQLIGSIQDRDKQVWLLVHMDANTKLIKQRKSYHRDHRVPPKYNSIPIEYIGWVKSNSKCLTH